MLRPEQKAAGRLFRDIEQALLLSSHETDPPTFAPPNFLAVYRHNCAGRNGRSTELALEEQYITSPEIVAWLDDGVWLAAKTGVIKGEPEGTIVEEGFFAFIYRAGRCRSCGCTARSRAGRLVVTRQRPPI